MENFPYNLCTLALQSASRKRPFLCCLCRWYRSLCNWSKCRFPGKFKIPFPVFQPDVKPMQLFTEPTKCYAINFFHSRDPGEPLKLQEEELAQLLDGWHTTITEFEFFRVKIMQWVTLLPHSSKYLGKMKQV